MSSNKLEVKYDAEYDVLLIYDKTGRSSHGVELGTDIDISFDQQGKLVNLSLNHASDILTNLTKEKITSDMLAQIVDSKLEIRESGGILYITFTFKPKNKQEISGVLPVKALNYTSPVSAAR